MGYIDFGAEIKEIKNHTGAIMNVISRIQKELLILNNKIESLSEKNINLTKEIQNLTVQVQNNKRQKIHGMNTRNRKTRKTA